MASKTEIANRALSKLGEGRVSNIDTDTNKPAKVMAAMWDIVRDAMLAAYPWNFAIARDQIAKDSNTPSWGYANKFSLPSDFLALLEVKSNPDYRIEGQYIVTDAGSPLYIRYIRRVTDTGEFDPLFDEALATRLAFESCEEITQSNSKKANLADELVRNIKTAYASDSIQDPPLSPQEDSWVTAREAG